MYVDEDLMVARGAICYAEQAALEQRTRVGLRVTTLHIPGSAEKLETILMQYKTDIAAIQEMY